MTRPAWPLDDHVARARARLLLDEQEEQEAERAYRAAEPGRRELVDWHAEYLLARTPGMHRDAAVRAAKVQALREKVLAPAPTPTSPQLPRGDRED